jgi:hypothetical protein
VRRLGGVATRRNDAPFIFWCRKGGRPDRKVRAARGLPSATPQVGELMNISLNCNPPPRAILYTYPSPYSTDGGLIYSG